MYQCKSSVTVCIAHVPYAFVGALYLHWQLIRQRFERMDVQWLLPRLNRDELRHGFTPARDYHRFTGFNTIHKRA
jgi:hypothetical protein